MSPQRWSRRVSCSRFPLDGTASSRLEYVRTGPVCWLKLDFFITNSLLGVW